MGQIYCDDFVAFFYFTDVYPGDGGLIVIPGSHKSEFQRPKDLLTLDEGDGIDPEPDPIFTNITARGGRCCNYIRAAHPRCLAMEDQRIGIAVYWSCDTNRNTWGTHALPQPILDRLSPETLELVASAEFQHTKEIVKQGHHPSLLRRGNSQ